MQNGLSLRPWINTRHRSIQVVHTGVSMYYILNYEEWLAKATEIINHCHWVMCL
jgi:hypothetical protein